MSTPSKITPLALFAKLHWLDGSPLLPHIEPYRRRIFEEAVSRDDAGRLLRNLVLCGRAKKNWKTSDAVLAALHALIDDSPGGNQVYVLANDEDQAGDDLAILKLLIGANPALEDELLVRAKHIERRDGRGFIEILPAKDVAGAHGKTFRLCVFDEVHGIKNWDIFEAMQLDPTRIDAQWWITSYASLFHKPGVPLFDLMKTGREGTDPRMLFSWYGGDFTTDPDFAEATPEARANPSMASWPDPDYLSQQRTRLPGHKYRRLHLNLPGLPEGSAFQAEAVMQAVDRSVRVREPLSGVVHRAFVDMSGGSSDDAVLGIAHQEDNRLVLDRLMNQGAPVPFDPHKAVGRFAAELKRYGCSVVTGDAYAGQTFRSAFAEHGISYEVSARTRSEIYEAFEVLLNTGRVVLLDAPTLEQQLLGLVWRGGRIDHPAGEHDDWANAGAGAIVATMAPQLGAWAEFVQRQYGGDLDRERAQAARVADEGVVTTLVSHGGDGDHTAEAIDSEALQTVDAGDGWGRRCPTPM